MLLAMVNNKTFAFRTGYPATLSFIVVIFVTFTLPRIYDQVFMSPSESVHATVKDFKVYILHTHRRKKLGMPGRGREGWRGQFLL